MTEVGQRADNAIVTPAGVLLSHADYQGFDCGIDARPTGIRAAPGSIELAGNQPPVPAEDGIWLGYTRHFDQILTADSLANLGQSGPLGV
jgi:hypothetical protein